MGLFSDNLDYKDLDALCIKVKRNVGDTTIELPVYVEVRISYVTWNNAKDVTIDDETVKDLKKSGRLAGAIKPIFERYITEEVNAHPEYAEEIFPNDFFGAPQLEFSEKRAKDIIDSRLFKEALTKVDDPDGFEEVKFEKIYGIALVGFKIWTVTSGLTIPYDISGIISEKSVLDGQEISAPESNTDSNGTVHDDADIEITPESADAKVHEKDEISRLQEEVLALEANCVQKQSEIQSAKNNLGMVLRSVSSLETKLKIDKMIVAKHDTTKELLSQCASEFKGISNKIDDLKLIQVEKEAQLENLKTSKIEYDTNLLYSIVKHTSDHLL